nr:MAG TPA: hypothetical protein [Caudoviricetes sp.]
MRNLINSDKLQTHGLSIHVAFPPSENGGGFLLTKQNQFAIIGDERTGFSARPDANQGGLSVSSLKKLLSILEAIFVCQEQNGVLRVKWGI